MEDINLGNSLKFILWSNFKTHNGLNVKLMFLLYFFLGDSSSIKNAMNSHLGSKQLFWMRSLQILFVVSVFLPNSKFV
jgi:hypothetical protein